MKEIIEIILKSHGQLELFLTSSSFHLRIENEPYMPLVIEKHGDRVMITHYLEQNGDLVPNPDLEFEILQDGTWSPIVIQSAFGIYKRAVSFESGQRFIHSLEMQDQIEFSKLWAKNLKEQGYIKP